MHGIKNYMRCNGKKWVLQKASLKIFEVILIPSGSIATYSMSAMFPGPKNRAQKITSKHWNACFHTGELTTNPSDPSEKAALIPCAAFFMSSRALEPRNAVYSQSHSPCSRRKPATPLQPFPGWEGEPRPSVGCVCLSQQVPAGHTWRRGGACVHTQPRHRDCAAAPAWALTHSTHVLPGELHTSHWLSERVGFFLSNLATDNEEWTDLKVMIVLGVYSKTFP